MTGCVRKPIYLDGRREGSMWLVQSPHGNISRRKSVWVARGVRAKPSGQQSQTRGGSGDPLRSCEDFAEGWQNQTCFLEQL